MSSTSSATPQSSKPVHFWMRLLLAVLLVTVFLVLGLFYRYPQLSRYLPNYQPPLTPSEITARNLPDFSEVSAMFAIFYTEANLPDLSRTFVSFPYYTDRPNPEIWLKLSVKPSAPEVTVLVSHPIVAQLQQQNWQRLGQDYLSLYQKQTTYQSIDQFLKSPPRSVKILADPVIIARQPFKTWPNIHPLQSDTQLSEYAYFITTYTPPKPIHNYYVFSTMVDASQASLNQENQLTWILDMPEINPDNKLYLGEIHVDYRQYQQQTKPAL